MRVITSALVLAFFQCPQHVIKDVFRHICFLLSYDKMQEHSVF